MAVTTALPPGASTTSVARMGAILLNETSLMLAATFLPPVVLTCMPGQPRR